MKEKLVSKISHGVSLARSDDAFSQYRHFQNLLWAPRTEFFKDEFLKATEEFYICKDMMALDRTLKDGAFKDAVIKDGVLKMVSL